MARNNKGMNKGPEIYNPEDLKVEYSRQERLEMTRFPDGRGLRRNRRFSLRLLLLDLLLLCIIGGVIYPFIIHRNSTGTIDGVRCTLTARPVSEDILISVRMINTGNDSEQKPFVLEIQINGKNKKTISDITPPPGEERYIRFRISAGSEKYSIKTFIRIGDQEIELNTVSSHQL